MDFHFALSKCFFHGAADGSGKVIPFVPMPVSLQDWRAGIANVLVQYSVTPPRKFKYFSSGLMIACFYIFLYIYLFVALSVIAIPVTILKISVISHFSSSYVGYILYFLFGAQPTTLRNVPKTFVVTLTHLQMTAFFVKSLMDLFLGSFCRAQLTSLLLIHREHFLRVLSDALHIVLAILLVGQLYNWSYSNILLLRAGDISPNPGPFKNGLRFFHWNLKSLNAREKVKIPLIESYNSIYHYDLIAISESMLDKSIPNDDIFMHGFSGNIFRSDNPGELKIGGVCLYYKENLPITQRLDLQVLDEMIVSEIKIGRKKYSLL